MRHQHVPDQEKCPSQDIWPRPRNVFWIKIYVLDQIKCLRPRKMSQTKKNVPALMGHQNGPGQCICPRQRYMSQTKEYVPDQENVPDQDKCDVPGQNKYPFPDETPTYCRLGKISQTEIYDPDWDIWPSPRYMTQSKIYILDWDICSHTDGILKCPRLWIMPQNNIYPRPRGMSQTLHNIAMFQTHNCWWVWTIIEWTWIWFEPNMLVYLQPEPW